MAFSASICAIRCHTDMERKIRICWRSDSGSVSGDCVIMDASAILHQASGRSG